MDGAQQQCTTCANILGSTAQRLRQLEEECQQLRASQLEYSKRLQFLENGLRSLDDDDLPHEMGSTTHYLTPPGLLTFRRPSGMLGRGPQNDLPAVAGADLARLSRSISDQCWHGVMRDSSGERSSVMFLSAMRNGRTTVMMDPLQEMRITAYHQPFMLAASCCSDHTWTTFTAGTGSRTTISKVPRRSCLITIDMRQHSRTLSSQTFTNLSAMTRDSYWLILSALSKLFTLSK
jgi:hypothetical protein